MGIEQLNEAIKLTKKGWVIHPLACPNDPGSSPGKRPLLNNWQKRKKAAASELKEWFEKTDNNVGLVLGKESGIIVIDLDKLDWVDVLFPPEQKILEGTLRASRTTGRGHVYFRYTDKVGNWKFHEFGIEILGERTQVVVPPSVHREGQQYKWQMPEGADLETFEPPEIPKTVIETIKLLKKLDEKIKGCRTCFKWVVSQSKDAMHGKEGRRLMLATSTELKAEHVTLEEFRLYAKKVYGDNYDPVRTNEEWKGVDAKKRWKCDTIRENFPEILKFCETCPKKSLDDDYIDLETAKKAIEIMTKGDPIGYTLDTWNKFHSGDRPFGYVLLYSSVCSSILASDGLPINFNGDSGGGKSHACRSMLHLIPKKWWIRRSLSDKAIFYSDSIQPDMIFFSDDVQMSDEFKMIFKNSVSDFQEQIEHETVNIQRKSELLKAPPRLTWWLTAVADIGNVEVERRCLKIVVEVNEQRLKTISDRLQKRRQKGEEKYPEDYPEVKICRAIFKELKSKKEKVIFNFNIKFKDGLSTDTQNMIYELLLATALINKYQRQRDDDGAIIAAGEDFKTVVDNFAAVSDTQVSKLTKSELLVARYLKQVGCDVSSNTIQEYFKKSKGWVSQVMKGKNGDGGLLSKMPNVVEEDVTTKDETESVRKKMYRFVGEWNELAVSEGYSRVHLGRRKEEGEFNWSSDTIYLENQAIWSAVRDVIRNTFDPANFESIIARLKTNAETPVSAPVQAVDNIVTHIGLTEATKEMLLKNFLEEKDYTQWGLTNALTATAKQFPAPEDQVELETKASDIALMPAGAFLEIVDAKPNNREVNNLMEGDTT